MARLLMYGLTMSMRSVAASIEASMASLIGWWPVPGTFQRTVVGDAPRPPSGTSRVAAGKQRSSGSSSATPPPSCRQLARNTSWSWATTGPVTRHMTS